MKHTILALSGQGLCIDALDFWPIQERQMT